MTEPRITPGIIDVVPRYPGDTIRQWVIPGTFPKRYWDVEWEPEPEERSDIMSDLEPTIKHCARCKREIKPRYTYCYRCTNYIRVKQRLELRLRQLERKDQQHEHSSDY